jgi:hypothetical protein
MVLLEQSRDDARLTGIFFLLGQAAVYLPNTTTLTTIYCLNLVFDSNEVFESP